MKKFFTVCIFFMACTLICAQEKDNTQDSLKSFLLEEVVLSANRWEQNMREVSSRISKVNSALIKFQNPQTAADLLGASNQVFIQKSQMGGGSPLIRGFATNRVLLVVDGVRMNNAIFRSGNVQNVISLDANSIRESEIIFGPGSVIYGSDAIGGVMDFHTLTPRRSDSKKILFQANGLTRYSSANQEYTNHIDLNLGFKKLSFLNSYTHSEFDNLRTGPSDYLRPDYQTRINGVDTLLINSDPELQINSGYSQDNLLQKILFQPGDDVSFLYSFHFSKTSNVPRYDRLILKNDDGTFLNSEWYYGPQKWMMHSLKVSVDRTTALWDHVQFIMAYQDYNESRHSRSLGSSNRTNRFENVKAVSANIDLDKELDKTTLYYGAEFVRNNVGSTADNKNISTGIHSQATTRYPDGSTWQSLAAYASIKHKFNESFLLNGSTRVSNVQTDATFDLELFPAFPFKKASANNTAVNGSLGLVYTPAPEWKFYYNLGTGFRAPNVDDIGKVFDSQPGDVVVPNPELKPEYAYSTEIGFAGQIENFSVDFAAYYSVIDNAIARAVSTFNGNDSIPYDGTNSRVLSQQNIGSVKVGGIQFGINWNPIKYFQLTSNLNWQKGKETYPDSTKTYSPTHVAPLFGATHVIFFTSSIKVDVYANYNGEITFNKLALSERADSHLYAKGENGNPYAPSWWTLNLKASFQVSEYLTVDTGVENILDKRYRPYSSGITAAGRNVMIALRVKI